MTIIFIILAVMFLAGVALLRLGFLGLLVNDHPHCRRCRFDLSGLAPRAEWCPECGSTITGPGSIRVGLRRRRPFAVGVGAVLILLSASPFLVSVISNDNFNRFMPLWLLRLDLLSHTAERSTAAAIELEQRVGAISSSEAAYIADALLDAQSDCAVPWRLPHAWLVGKLRLSRSLSPAQEQRLIRQACSVELRTRDTLASTAGLPYSVKIKDFRWEYRGTSLSFAVRPRITIDGVRMNAPSLNEWSVGAGFSGSVLEGGFGAVVPLTLTEGTHEMVFELDMMTYVDSNANIDTHEELLASSTPRSPVWTERRESKLLVKPDMPSALSVGTRDNLTDLLASSILVRNLTYAVDSGLLVAELQVVPPPQDLELIAFAKMNGKEYELGKVRANKGARSVSTLRRDSFDTPVPATIDIVLRPDYRAAYEDVDAQLMWGGTLVLKELSVNPR